jgi:hypothetical protein
MAEKQQWTVTHGWQSSNDHLQMALKGEMIICTAAMISYTWVIKQQWSATYGWQSNIEQISRLKKQKWSVKHGWKSNNYQLNMADKEAIIIYTWLTK